MKTAVVILNWNTRDYLKSFLPSLISSLKGMDAEVVVADSASTDGSLELLAGSFPEIKTIPLDKNYGFTGGYDRAIAQIADGQDAPEYVVLLNSDIEVPDGWLKPLVAQMDSDPKCGVCGPKLHALVASGDGYARTERFEYAGAAGGRLDRFGYPYCRGRVLKRTEQDCGQYDTRKDVAWVSGACLMTRTSLWKKLGGLDDRFFAHMEEIDYCWRAWLEGFRVTVVPESCVYHLGGGTLPQSSPFKLKLNYRNGLLMLDGNLPRTYGKAAARRILACRMALDWASAAAYTLTGKPSSAKAVAEAYKEFRKLRRKAPKAEIRDIRPAGLDKVSVILQSALRGKGIFDYLRRYEDSH